MYLERPHHLPELPVGDILKSLTQPVPGIQASKLRDNMLCGSRLPLRQDFELANHRNQNRQELTGADLSKIVGQYPSQIPSLEQRILGSPAEVWLARLASDSRVQSRDSVDYLAMACLNHLKAPAGFERLHIGIAVLLDSLLQKVPSLEQHI